MVKLVRISISISFFSFHFTILSFRAVPEVIWQLRTVDYSDWTWTTKMDTTWSLLLLWQKTKIIQSAQKALLVCFQVLFFLECRNSAATPPLNLELDEESEFPLSATPFYLSALYLGLGSWCWHPLLFSKVVNLFFHSLIHPAEHTIDHVLSRMNAVIILRV